MNMNDKTDFADGPLKGQYLRAHLATERVEGDHFTGHYELVTVAFYSEENRELRTRKEYRYRVGIA